ncbi:MAG: hypothetical protein C5B50_05835 [Verrucomicrobia bacterium]|nr:MAG: hypothetical protein C5B50_05835 [Verrucomicrobiota bacterium]
MKAATTIININGIPRIRNPEVVFESVKGATGGTERGIYAASTPERTEAPGLSGPFIELRTVKRHKCRAPARGADRVKDKVA